MACDLYLAPSFPQLETLLNSRLKQGSGAGPLAPRWLVVPTSTLARRLRLKLAANSDFDVVAGLRITPLTGLAQRLSPQVSLPAERWEPLLDLLLQEAAGRVPGASPLALLRHQPTAFSLLKPTFQDLADGGFGASESALLEELAAGADLSSLEVDLLRLYGGWVQLLADARIGWRPLQDQATARWVETANAAELSTALGAEEGALPEILAFGFYDLTDVNTELVCALSRRLPVSLFYPCLRSNGRPHPAYRFADSFLQELEMRLGSQLRLVCQQEAEGGLTSFFVDTFPAGDVGPQPTSISHQTACGRRAEVIAAAARIRSWLDDPVDPLEPDEILVVVPDDTGYAATVRDVFSHFAIATQLADIAVDAAPETRPLRLLSLLWSEGAPAELLLAFLREAPEVVSVRGIDLEHFEKELRRRRCWGGKSFKTLLEMRDSRDCDLTEEEVSLVSDAVALWVDSSAEPRSIEGWTRWFDRLAGDWLDGANPLRELAEALKTAAALRPGLLLETATVQRLLDSTWAARRLSEPTDKNAVFVTPLMRARGLTARGMVILGLAAGTFPVELEEDPLLSDDSRRRLRRAGREGGHRLALRAGLSDEMPLLFILLNTAAEKLHWVIPETDELGKSVSPTPWVQRYQRAWKGGALARIPRGPRQQAEALLKQARDGRLLPPDLGFLLDGRLALLVGDAAHYGYVAQTRGLQLTQPDWQGYIRAPGWKTPLPDPGDPPRVSVTQLENLARCPYRFYASFIAGWRPLEVLQFNPGLSPLEWGSLVHGFLESIFEPAIDQGATVAARAAELLGDDARLLRKHVQSLPARLSAGFRFLPPLLAGATRWRLQSLIRNYLESVGGACSNGQVQSVERKLRRPFPGMEPLLISGVIDRVDRHGSHCSVIDYKSGKPPGSSRRALRDEIALGFRMQPWLYPWLLEDTLDSAAPSFGYVFLGGQRPSQIDIERPGDADDLLFPLGRILREGFFFPTSNESLSRALGHSLTPCEYCQLSSLCRRFEDRRTRQALRWLLKLVPERFGVQNRKDVP